MANVVIDANVLFRGYVRGALLWTSFVGLFEVRWTKRILRETYSNLVLRDMDTAEGIRAFDRNVPAGADAGHLSAGTLRQRTGPGR